MLRASKLDMEYNLPPEPVVSYPDTPDPFLKKVNDICGMFPDVDRAKISAILTHRRENVEETIEQILSGNLEVPAQSKPTAPLAPRPEVMCPSPPPLGAVTCGAVLSGLPPVSPHRGGGGCPRLTLCVMPSPSCPPAARCHPRPASPADTGTRGPRWGDLPQV